MKLQGISVSTDKYLICLKNKPKDSNQSLFLDIAKSHAQNATMSRV